MAERLAARGLEERLDRSEATARVLRGVTRGGLKFLGDVSPYKIDHLRIIAGAMFAYILEIIGLAAADGSEAGARFVRDYLTMFYPAEAAQPSGS